MTQALKSITLELPEEDWAALEREAEIVNLTLEELVGVKFRRSLKGLPTQSVLTREQKLAQAELFTEASKVFQQAARELGLREEDVVPMVRAARAKLADEQRDAKRS